MATKKTTKKIEVKEVVETPVVQEVVETPVQNGDNVTRNDSFYADSGTNHNVSKALPSLDD